MPEIAATAMALCRTESLLFLRIEILAVMGADMCADLGADMFADMCVIMALCRMGSSLYL